MAEVEKDILARGRSDSKNSADAWHLSNLSILSGQMTSSGGSERLDTEVPSPPLAVISTRVKSAAALENCANFETATVKYAYDTTTLSRLLKSIGERLRGRKALSVALVVHGSPGCFKLCSRKVQLCILHHDMPSQSLLFMQSLCMPTIKLIKFDTVVVQGVMLINGCMQTQTKPFCMMCCTVGLLGILLTIIITMSAMCLQYCTCRQ